DVRAVVDIAAAVGLEVVVDAIQGHLSSFDFVPSWLTTCHRPNMYTDPDVVAATGQIVQALSARVSEARNQVGMSLGNEVNQFSASNPPDPDELTVEQAEDWTGAMFEAARLGAPAGMDTVANYDAAWFMDDHVFTPDQSARFGEAQVIHRWIFAGTGQRNAASSYEA